jgi:tetratricopeptide (TPR) repeat protein
MSAEVGALHDQGCAAINAGQYLRAGSFFERAYQRAEAESDAAAVLHNRIGCANCLRLGMQLRAALAVLGPALTGNMGRTPDGGHLAELPDAVLTYARVALSLPAQLRDINEAIGLFERINPREKRRLLLVLRLDVSRRRTLLRGVKQTQELLLDRRRADCLALADAYLDEGDVERAARWLDTWEQDKKAGDERDEPWEFRLRSRLARLSGDGAEALRWARRAARAVPRGKSATYAEHTAARALLAFGEVEQAWPHVQAALADLTSESAFDKRSAHLLHGDYWLARARRCAGLPAADDADGSAFSIPDRVEDTSELRRALGSAQDRYQAARALAQKLDELLECGAYVRQVEERLGRVSAIEAAVGTRALASG